MELQSLLKNCAIDRIMNAVAAGTTDQTATFDMTGYEGALVIALFGTLTSGAVTGIKFGQGAASNGSDAVDLLGSALAIADSGSNKMLASEIYRPRPGLGKYVTVTVDRGTQNAVIDGLVLIRFGKKGKLPITQGATVANNKRLEAPAAGTA